MQPNETRRVEFTFPQYRALALVLRQNGIRESHKCDLDIWQARALYEAAQALPTATTRQFILRESILKKLEWAFIPFESLGSPSGETPEGAELVLTCGRAAPK